METEKKKKALVFNRKRLTVVVLVGFVLLALVAAYLYHNTEDHLSPESLQQKFEQQQQQSQ